MTFSGGKSASDTADFINAILNGATAIVREVGSSNFLEINTNTFSTSGSLEIKGASTANGSFAFELDSEKTSGDPNKAFAVSGSAEPYDFAEADSLVVVIDNNIVDNTFNILMNFGGSITAATSTTIFSDSTLPNVFPTSDELVDFFVAFTSGANTTTEAIDTVADQTSNIFRYSFANVPTNFVDFAIGDLLKITGLADSENNGNFIVVAKGAQSMDVLNPNGVNASLQSGTGVISQRRQITAYNQLTGEMTVGSAFRATPSVSDPLIVIPSTIDNLVNYINNTKITSFTLKGTVEGVENYTKLQLASVSSGSDGFIQVTGGDANSKLNFDTDLVRGIQAYSDWVGLTKLVHRTIYGDDNDLTSFPGSGAAGITFQILAPTTKELQIELDVDLAEGVSIASIENEIKSAVSGYVNGLGVGDDVIIEEIRAAVIKITGIVDVRLNNPTDNITIADNELARVPDHNIVIG